MAARRFLWIVAGLTVLVMVGAVFYAVFQRQLMRIALVPSAPFEAPAGPAALDYAGRANWIARPDIAGNPAAWLPDGAARASAAPRAEIFFIHPTSFLERWRWNAAVDDRESQDRARLFVRSEASAFNGVGEVWAPKYRQATFGAFLTRKADAQKALDFAYGDVRAAFDAFLAQAPKDRPIILAGHSQGSLHLVRLLAERVAGQPVARRIAAVYAAGWPISVTADLPRLGLPGCEAAGQSGCILAWQSFAEPADPRMVTERYDASRGLTGARRAGSPMLCVNPISGMRGGAAPGRANLGTLVPNAALTGGRLAAPGVAARCDVRGFLLIGGAPPALGPYVLPGHNYHVYDYALFWANIRADAEARVTAWEKKR